MTNRRPDEARSRSASTRRWIVRFGDVLGSPLLLAASVILLVASIGLVSTVSTYRRLQHAGERRAQEMLHERALALRVTLDESFGVADVLLDRLEPVVRSADPAAPIDGLVTSLRALASARRGLTWTSASFPDGTFVGLFVADDGELHVVENREGRIRREYVFAPDGRLHLLAQTEQDYDPRTRAFYRAAIAARRRLWTEPYPFLPLLRTGITRAAPLYRDAADPGSLLAVLTVDYDAWSLTDLLGRHLLPGERVLVTTGEGAVLAVAGTRLPELRDRSRERALTVADLHDPILDAALGEAHATRVEVGGAGYRIDREGVGRIAGRPIVLTSLVPEAVLYAGARQEARNGMVTTALTALVGLLLATALSANIARLRRKREEAERDARLAREHAAELGSYELLDRIGAGGMGEVYRARHVLLARDAALKLIKPDRRHDAEDDQRRFYEEARLLASMRSLHTVAVYDFGVAEDGRYFLAMELLDGLDLEALVRLDGMQPPTRVASILAQICDSLAEAHAAGLVHQDIKPANVFLCRLAESLDFVKVLDFGLTRAIGRRRSDGRTVEGTPAFMAPEQALGEEVSFATDLYAVGCVGFYLLSGRYPYPAHDSDASMRAHVSAAVPELPEAVRAHVPASLVQLVTRCLAKKPANRPASAAALARALRRVASECEAGFPEDARIAFWAKRAGRAQEPPRAGTSELDSGVLRVIRSTVAPPGRRAG